MKVFVFCICALLLGFVSSNLTGSAIGRQLKTAVSTLDSNFRTCMAENNVTEDDWYREDEVLADVHKESGNEERTRKLGCSVACLLKKENMMEGANIKEGKIYARISKEVGNSPVESMYQKIAHDCLTKVRNMTEECEKSLSLLYCVVIAVNNLERPQGHNRTEIKESEEVEQTV
ncbi:pheromone-binding protein Gp-9-like [Anoplolepis gracilipes]|uniref:pheromone-binding protein Gp-9-like n=1 Tax=Anoplolepis gracilipes TaxID=354296 RepID=UPI003B9F6132